MNGYYGMPPSSLARRVIRTQTGLRNSVEPYRDRSTTGARLGRNLQQREGIERGTLNQGIRLPNIPAGTRMGRNLQQREGIERGTVNQGIRLPNIPAGSRLGRNLQQRDGIERGTVNQGIRLPNIPAGTRLGRNLQQRDGIERRTVNEGSRLHNIPAGRPPSAVSWNRTGRELQQRERRTTNEVTRLSAAIRICAPPMKITVAGQTSPGTSLRADDRSQNVTMRHAKKRLHPICPICLNDAWSRGTYVYNIKCGHVLCKICLQNMLGARHFKCPVCRGPFFPAIIKILA